MARILIIDDDPLILLAFKVTLEGEGHEIVTAMNGQEGIDLFSQTHFDLIITDMILPVKDGLQVIMEVDAKSPNTPLIAISGGGVIGAEQYLAIARNVGARKALAKPLTAQELIAAVNAMLA